MTDVQARLVVAATYGHALSTQPFLDPGKRVVKLLPAEARAVEAWSNGRGRTQTVERTAGWRVSVAEVSDDAPFSSFPGLSRILMPLSSAGIVLSVNGERRALGTLEATEFEGEDAVHAHGLVTPAEVLNLMWRRHTHSAALTRVSVSGSILLEGDVAVRIAIVTSGRLALAGGATLARLDGLHLDSGESVTVSGSGELALASIMDVTKRSE